MKNEDINLQSVLLHQNSLVEARRWQLLSVVFVGVIVLLALAITLLTPLKTTEIRYVEFSKAGTYNFRVLQTPLGKDQKILLIRYMLRNYVVKRVSYTGNVNLDTPNIMTVASMSSNEVLQQFKEVYERIENESSFERRDVEIISDIPMGRGAHRIEYKTVDYFKGQKYENTWVAKISYSLENSLVIEDNELENPLGLFINEFLKYNHRVWSSHHHHENHYYLGCSFPHCTSITTLSKYIIYTRGDSSEYVASNQALEKMYVCGNGSKIANKEE